MLVEDDDMLQERPLLASSTSSAVGIDYTKIIEQFLTGAKLRKVFSHLCNHASGHVADPILDIVHIMLTCPVQMVVSEVSDQTLHCVCIEARGMDDSLHHAQVGVALFKDHPNALYPFSEMDKDQRYYVEQIVLACLRQYDISASTTNHVVMQMGGGCILYTEPQNMHMSHDYASPSQPVHSPAVKKQSQNQQRSHARQVDGTKSSSNNNSTGGGGNGAAPDSGKKGASARIRLMPAEVLEALCDCIFASKR
jgi:hypothetical protein